MANSGYKLFNALIRPLRELDNTVGRNLLRRFLEGPQALFERQEAVIQTLPDQLDPSKVRAGLLRYLAPIVGFTPELRSITDRLTDTQMRRLIQVAVPLWNQRHTERGLVNAIRLLTGRTAFVANWFSYRNLLGETLLAEDQLAAGADSWIIGGETTVYDEYWSNVRLMDDGTLDELLLIDIIRLMRPMSERIEVVLLDFLDRFDGELDKWTITGTEPTIVDGVMVLPAGTLAAPIIPIRPALADHEGYAIVTKFKLDGAASTFNAEWRVDGNNYYVLQIAPTGDVILARYTAGVPSFLYSAVPASVSIVPGTWYKLRVTVVNVGTARHLQVYIDSNLIIPTTGSHYIDNTGVAHQTGPYQFRAINDAVSLDNVESWEQPGRFATIELSTGAEPGGAVTMTGNFIQ